MTKEKKFLPEDIYNELKKNVIGQDEALKFIAVSIFKHTLGEKFGNLLLIGNSGTGKTTIMKAIENLYNSYAYFENYRAIIKLNANILYDEEKGTMPGEILFLNIEEKVKSLFKNPQNLSLEKIKDLMEHSTICVDEVDKISSKVGDKPYVPGITVQQALLTLMEGEEIIYPLTIIKNNEIKKVNITLDTGKMLFICGGAFEELYNIVRYRVVVKEKKNVFKAKLEEGKPVKFQDTFTLKEYLQQEDLFEYGMLPQFLSRFDNRVVLKDLNINDLQTIFMDIDNSLFKTSKKFFQKYNIELYITEGAKKLIAEASAKYTRIGARALTDVYGRIIKNFEYNPFNKKEVKKTNGKYKLVIDEEIVKSAIGEEE